VIFDRGPLLIPAEGDFDKPRDLPERCAPVVLAKSDLIDKLGVCLFIADSLISQNRRASGCRLCYFLFCTGLVLNRQIPMKVRLRFRSHDHKC